MTSKDEPHPFYGDSARKAGGASWSGAGLGRGHSRGAADDAFAYQGDSAGVRRWVQEHHFMPAPEVPPVVAKVMRAAPVLLGPEHVATEVVAGRFGGWDAIAFNVGVQMKQGVVPKWAMTAVGRSQVGSPFWLHPQRLGRFRPREHNMAILDLGSSQLASRWTARADSANNHIVELLQAQVVIDALLATDDGDEIWATDAALAAVRPDNHRPQLLEHHLRLLTILAEAETAVKPSR